MGTGYQFLMSLQEKLLEGATLEAGGKPVTMHLSSGSLIAMFALVLLALTVIFYSNLKLRDNIVLHTHIAELQNVAIQQLRETVRELKLAVIKLDEEHPPSELYRAHEDIRDQINRVNGRVDRIEERVP